MPFDFYTIHALDDSPYCGIRFTRDITIFGNILCSPSSFMNYTILDAAMFSFLSTYWNTFGNPSYASYALLRSLFVAVSLILEYKPSVILICREDAVWICYFLLYCQSLLFYLCAFITEITPSNLGNHAYTWLFLLPQHVPHREHNSIGNHGKQGVNHRNSYMQQVFSHCGHHVGIIGDRGMKYRGGNLQCHDDHGML